MLNTALRKQAERTVTALINCGVTPSMTIPIVRSESDLRKEPAARTKMRAWDLNSPTRLMLIETGELVCLVDVEVWPSARSVSWRKLWFRPKQAEGWSGVYLVVSIDDDYVEEVSSLLWELQCTAALTVA